MKKIFWFLFVIFCSMIVSCSKKQYEVKFLGYNDEIIEVINVTSSELVTYPTAPLVNGYDFVKWDKEIDYTSEDIVIKAIYQIKELTVTFYDNNDEIMEIKHVKYNSNIIDVPVLTVEGYEFVEWDHDLNNITNDLEVRPILQKNNYVVKFYDEAGNLLKEEIVGYGDCATAITPSNKDGYRFVRWDESIDNVKSNLDVYPIYEAFLYTITFVDMYGEVLKTETVKYSESAKAPNAPELQYYRFTGWDLDFSEVTNNMTVKAQYEKIYSVYAISNVNYWLQILSNQYNINKTILTSDEITAYNSVITSNYSKTSVVDVLSITGTKTQSYVAGLINDYANINKYTVYNKDTNIALSTSEKNAILANRNLENISSNVSIEYGIISDFAWVRSYPTNHYSNDYKMDRFQETSLNVGEGVAIYHESLDHEWYFVQAENYNGWVEKKYIAKCSYADLEAFLKPADNLLVISDYVTIETAHVRMGQSFPLLNVSTDSYTLNFPSRNSDGTLLLKEVVVAKSDAYHVGYLDYTYQNVFAQGFKLLGIDYSWGDKDKLGRDCSSTMNAIYKCFGFMMPRNTTDQLGIPTYGSKVNGLTNTSIQTYKPGTLIFTSSHVMLYLGENENGLAYLLHNTTSGNGECILQSLNDYGGSRIIGVLVLQ